MTSMAMVFVLVGWVAMFAVFCTCGYCAVQYFRNGDLVKCLVCAVACIVAAIPIVTIGF